MSGLKGQKMSEMLVYSDLGADEDLGELVEMFVMELPNRIDSLQEALGGNDLSTLKTLAHQMKGAAGSYGFHAISPVAAALEEVATDDNLDIEIQHCVQDLVGICQRARAGAPC